MSQLGRLQELEVAISGSIEARQKRIDASKPRHNLSHSQRFEFSLQSLVANCRALLGGADPTALEKVCRDLLAGGVVNVTIAHFLRCGNFNAIQKFAKADVPKICRMCYLQYSSFLEDAQSALKEGNRQNITASSTEAWKQTFDEKTQLHSGTPWFQEILDLEDVMDAFCRVESLRHETVDLSKQVGKSSKARPVLTGRAASAAARTRVANLKRKLSDLSAEGNPAAATALEMMSEKKAPEGPPAPEEDPDQEPGGPKRRNKRGVRKGRKARLVPEHLRKKPYARKAGDELRLSRKREIATWQFDAFCVFIRRCCDMLLRHLLNQINACSGLL